ncbi:hypothetical protein JCM3770_004962, partial [Rhodotorula araucariae]
RVPRAHNRYLNPQGVIPASATFAKGENPERVRGSDASPAGAGAAVEGAESDDDEAAGVGGEDDG